MTQQEEFQLLEDVILENLLEAFDDDSNFIGEDYPYDYEDDYSDFRLD